MAENKECGCASVEIDNFPKVTFCSNNTWEALFKVAIVAGIAYIVTRE